MQLIISDYEICVVSADLYVQSTKKGIVFYLDERNEKLVVNAWHISSHQRCSKREREKT
jgi:hypothetical protein